MQRNLTIATLALALSACGGHQTGSDVDAPGREETPVTQALDAGASALQDKPPIEALNAYLDGFHFYNGRMDAQMEAHHYCAVLNEELIQCVIYDGSVREAKMMGVEYIISGELFAGLPAAEQALWHSHVHEVKSGTLVAPGLPEVAERALMEKLVGTYGKTWHTWHTDQDDALPLGVPQLMMAFTADGQADPAMIAERDARLGIDSAARRESRSGIPAPRVHPEADAWQRGQVYQVPDPTGQTHHPEHQQQGVEAPGRNADSDGDAGPSANGSPDR